MTSNTKQQALRDITRSYEQALKAFRTLLDQQHEIGDRLADQIQRLKQLREAS